MPQQKYKIYINGVPVFLISHAEFLKISIPEDKFHYVAHYLGKKKQIKQYLDLLNKRKDIRMVVLHSYEIETLWADFLECYKILEAAGGYVLNKDKELLVFFRRGSWDMPKGKIDPGETPEIAAIREVQEETGLINVTLGAFLIHTYHTYEQNGRRILKKTWWYRMTTTDMDLTPQIEEDITDIKWVEPVYWLKTEPIIYSNIKDVVDAGLISR